MRSAVIGAAALVLSGCATPYQEHNFWTGGVKHVRIDETTLQIEAEGNELTSGATIERFVLRRAAEQTLAAGYGHFAITSTSDTSQSGAMYLPGASTTNVTGYGNIATANTYASPGMAFGFSMPGRTALVKMYAGPKPAAAPANVFDAQELLRYMVPPPKAK